jgi:uncharacterized protein (DUF2236 family)
VSTGPAGDGTGRDTAPPPLVEAARMPQTGAFRAARHHPDDEPLGHWGLFGPESVTWKVHSDPLFGLAILRSLLLRVLHPDGVAAVFATASRVDDPWERLAWTQRHLGVATFGSSSEAAIAGARLRAVLMQVHGTTHEGNDFSGDDPDQLRWMHACQVVSAIEVTRRGGLDLTDREHELYVREQVRMAALWGLEPDEVPGTRAELTRYFRTIRPELRMSAAARSFIGAVVSPTEPAVMALARRDRPAWSPVAGLAYSCLPVWARRIHGPPPGSGPATLNRAATTVALHSLRDSLRGRGDHTPVLDGVD